MTLDDWAERDRRWKTWVPCLNEKCEGELNGFIFAMEKRGPVYFGECPECGYTESWTNIALKLGKVNTNAQRKANTLKKKGSPFKSRFNH